ncbi:hypothetical protein I5677_02125 [Mobilitalea sibirica]|uniref:Uncharacterized protein n=1 Tax=Mobilitalea sibirica TaxID=1462919 RepID=A0A8J7H0K5_9FIRM|nr:hypothetical protein [Mobilitalea sibirica]MBH1939689.1 hypothetical protein [Mobilitalea sibirica]
MDKNLKTIYKDILHNRIPEVNIPRFFNHMVNHYHTYASIRLALHYYTYYEVYCDEHKEWNGAAKDLTRELNQIIRRNVLGKTVLPEEGNETDEAGSIEEAVRRIDKIRNEIMKRMNVLTAYTDIFYNYEYILNRVEYRFQEEEVLPEEDDIFARDVLRYIFDTQDNVVINEKIKEIVGQIPVRMAKQKYYDLLRESFQPYLGAELSSLQTYLYMLRTSAMLQKEEGMETYYPWLWDKKNELASINYKEITKSQYEEATDILTTASELLLTETAIYYSLQEIVNEVYSVLLCAPYVGVEDTCGDKWDKASFEIISEINRLFYEETYEEPPTKLIEVFGVIEGVQEEMIYDLTALEEALYEIDVNHRKLTESLMMDKLLNTLLLCKDLLSNSLFIDFYEIRMNQPVDEDRLTVEADKLINELAELFENHDKVVSRAVMANTLNKIPVFFKNHTEVMEYIRYSLEKCTDLVEKIACMRIIRDIMSE